MKKLVRNLYSRHLSTVNESIFSSINNLGTFVDFQKKEIFEHRGDPSTSLQTLMRPIFYEMKDHIDAKDKSYIHISGDRGVGKSLLLQQAVHYARSSGWLVLYLPNSFDLIDESKALQTGTDTAQAIIRSKLTPDKFSQPLVAQSILSQFLESHQKELTGLQQQFQYDHSLYKRKIGGAIDTSLATIALRGQKDMMSASNALFDLRLELSLVEEHPVMVAIDDANTLYWPSCFFAKGIRVPTDDLLVPATFRSLDTDGNLLPNHELKNGMILTASTGTKQCQIPFNDSETPFLKDGRIKNTQSVHGIQVKKYTSEEFDKVFNERRKVLQMKPKFNIELEDHFSSMVEIKNVRQAALNGNYDLFKVLTGLNPEILEKRVLTF